jgi:hypothetical protein
MDDKLSISYHPSSYISGAMPLYDGSQASFLQQLSSCPL